ncbi:hypothetical protein GCM10007874_11350 [Labrys miyagiensis]|uniref:Uncharacterized protein n=1 Tax=Labrys miyagiensis TaxID=346912 RepID=A0ABQ6CHC4_9HYPH|nr:hypothetical protein [Labrys miyagiensis]GLS18119.1 hypothetical protein GCM10007874_11350 [Labrys miyagiensis]
MANEPKIVAALSIENLPGEAKVNFLGEGDVAHSAVFTHKAATDLIRLLFMRPPGHEVTVNVTASKSGLKATGEVAVVLKTAEFGSIAIKVDQRAIDFLRRELIHCENVLKAQSSAKH